jgi:hypothetical protein
VSERVIRPSRRPVAAAESCPDRIPVSTSIETGSADGSVGVDRVFCRLVAVFRTCGERFFLADWAAAMGGNARKGIRRPIRAIKIPDLSWLRSPVVFMSIPFV